MKSAGVKVNRFNDGWIPFSCSSFMFLVLCMLVNSLVSLNEALEYKGVMVNVCSYNIPEVKDVCGFKFRRGSSCDRNNNTA